MEGTTSRDSLIAISLHEGALDQDHDPQNDTRGHASLR